MAHSGGVHALLQAAAQPQCSFVLQVVQEPVRARMCGLGDRDRRPISPPCVLKLMCRNLETGKIIPVEDIDTSFLVVAADLRTVDFKDANLVQPSPAMGSRHPSAALSDEDSSDQYSRSPSPDPSPQLTEQLRSLSPTDSAPARQGDLPTPPTTVPLDAGEFDPAASGSPSSDSHRSPLIKAEPIASTSAIPFHPRRPYGPAEAGFVSPRAKRRRTSESSTEPASFIPYVRKPKPRRGSLERSRPKPTAIPEVPNLIGALHANAFKLKDEDGQLGIFFVLPDLSVRTEGEFRLRLRLMSIGTSAGLCTDAMSPIVATANTQTFTVTSAKKFEGMMDPTPISLMLAAQGVRIPVRKAAKGKGRTAVASP